MKFVGVDLGWYSKPSGFAGLQLAGAAVELVTLDICSSAAEVLSRIDEFCAMDDALVAVDAPLIITNKTGMRSAERAINQSFWQEHAMCHSSNLGSKFAANTTAFSRELVNRNFEHGLGISRQQKGRFQIEVYPHPASVRLFGLSVILKYKKGPIANRIVELDRLRKFLSEACATTNPDLLPISR